MAGIRHPVTPDGRYFVVKGKLWRLSDPGKRARLVLTLMDARCAVKDAKSAGDRNAELDAHRQVDEAKRALGERGAGRGPRLQTPCREEHAICRLVLEVAIEMIRGALSRDHRRAARRRWVFENMAKVGGRAATEAAQRNFRYSPQIVPTSQPS